MSERNPRLDALIRKATVFLHSARPGDDAMWGSGFLVAPGWVLTCAHVLSGRDGTGDAEEFRVSGPGLNSGRPVAARLEAHLYDGSLDEPADESLPVEQDVALVRLLDSSVQHECVWLSDRPEHWMSDDRLVYGYRPDAVGRAIPWRGTARENTGDGEYRLRLGPDNEFPEGVSGGPVLDPATNAVVALIKCRRAGRDGGSAIALSVLRRFGPTLYGRVMADHDQWHATRESGHNNWIDIQTDQAIHANAARYADADNWNPADRRQALALLARVEPANAPSTIGMLVRLARGESPTRQPLSVVWRDGHGQLCEENELQDALVFLRYLRLVQLFAEARGRTEKSALEQLSEWTRARSGRIRPVGLASVREVALPDELLHGGPVVRYPRPGEGGVVLLELEPLAEDSSRVYWTLRVDDGSENGEVSWDDQRVGPGVELRGLGAVLEERLGRAFQAVDRPERPAPLEVATELRHFDLPVYSWRDGDQTPPRSLGDARPVVIRDAGRRRVSDESWETRWRGMMAAGQLTSQGTVFDSPSPAGDVADLPPGTVPLQCRPAGTGAGLTAMRMALDAGHGVALWHLQHYVGHANEECGRHCEKLYEDTARFLRDIENPDELPDHIRRIRQRSNTGTGRHWADSVALLYDDPERPLPPEEPEEGGYDSP